MTITTPQSAEGHADSARPTVAWTSIQAGLWIGNADGEFAGMIERSSTGEYSITDSQAHPLGTCATLDEAKSRHQRQLQLAASHRSGAN